MFAPTYPIFAIVVAIHGIIQSIIWLIMAVWYLSLSWRNIYVLPFEEDIYWRAFQIIFFTEVFKVINPKDDKKLYLTAPTPITYIMKLIAIVEIVLMILWLILSHWLLASVQGIQDCRTTVAVQMGN